MINSAQTHMESMSSRLPGCMVIIKRKPAVDSSSSRDWPTIVDFEQESTQILMFLLSISVQWQSKVVSPNC